MAKSETITWHPTREQSLRVVEEALGSGITTTTLLDQMGIRHYLADIYVDGMSVWIYEFKSELDKLTFLLKYS